MSSLVALLGRTSKPTCGIADYCDFLGNALSHYGVELDRAQVNWAEQGWLKALKQLQENAKSWKGKWILLQYTAGAWSRSGFPLGALLVVAILRQQRVRCAITYHEPWRWEVTNLRLIDRIRGAFQDWVIRRLFRFADKAIFPDPLEAIDWLPRGNQKSAFIPIGANVPEQLDTYCESNDISTRRKTVVVFCLSKPPNLMNELEDVACAVRFVADTGISVRVIFIGRGTAEAANEIQTAFSKVPAQIVNLGIRSAQQVSHILAGSDTMLCVRGRLFPRRGSALAGIVCGVPVLAYEGPAQNTPIAEAGVQFVRYRDQEALGAALARILIDQKLREEMRLKSIKCREQYFSWKRIAWRHIDALGLVRTLSQESQQNSATVALESTLCAS